MTRKQPKAVNGPIKIESEIVHDHYRVKNWIANEWMPIIGPYGLTLYNIYSSAANKERGNAWFFSFRTLQEYTFFSLSTINMYNWLLEACGLIRIKPGADGYANEYILLDPPHATEENLKKLVAVLEADTDVGKNWKSFKQNTLERIQKWKPLTECGKKNQHQKGGIENQKTVGQSELFTNKPEPKPTVKPSSDDDELITRLVEEFAENKPPLNQSGARKMIEQYGAKAVEQQLVWLAEREIQENPLKTLRAALKGDWSEPKEEPIPEPWYAGMEDIILH